MRFSVSFPSLSCNLPWKSVGFKTTLYLSEHHNEVSQILLQSHPWGFHPGSGSCPGCRTPEAEAGTEPRFAASQFRALNTKNAKYHFPVQRVSAHSFPRDKLNLLVTNDGLETGLRNVDFSHRIKILWLQSPGRHPPPLHSTTDQSTLEFK